RVRTDAHPGPTDRLEVDHAGQILHVGVEVVVAVRVLQRLLTAMTAHPAQARREQLVRTVRDPCGGVGVRGAAVGRVGLEAAVTGRVVAGGDHDAVGPPGISGRPAPVVDQDRVRDGGRGRVAVQRIDLRGDVVRGQNL